MAPYAMTSTQMTDSVMTDFTDNLDPNSSSKLQLKRSEWNTLVSDATQCMRLLLAEEIAYLSSKNDNLAQYLKHHPTEAHELMVPSGFKQCLIRRYQRFLSGTEPLCTQNGQLETASWSAASFDALLPGQPLIVSNPSNAPQPTWREVNAYVCKNGKDQLSGDKMAPEFEDLATGQRVRRLTYQGMQVETSLRQWHLMWDHIVCQYLTPHDLINVEFSALHSAYRELTALPNIFKEWKFHGGQQIAILLKQLEHRLRAAHVGRPNPCNQCCPFRPKSASAKNKYKEFLSKKEAAAIVVAEREKRSETLAAVSYDDCIEKVLGSKAKMLDECCSDPRCTGH